MLGCGAQLGGLVVANWPEEKLLQMRLQRRRPIDQSKHGALGRRPVEGETYGIGLSEVADGSGISSAATPPQWIIGGRRRQRNLGGRRAARTDRTTSVLNYSLFDYLILNLTTHLI